MNLELHNRAHRQVSTWCTSEWAESGASSNCGGIIPRSREQPVISFASDTVFYLSHLLLIVPTGSSVSLLVAA
jgi:hypothetical protein